MTSAKTFLVYVLAVLFGLLLLGSLRGIFNPIPVPEQSNWALRMGYWSGAALTIVIGSVGLLWSIRWIRRHKKLH